MKNVQISLDEDLVKEVDRLAKRLHSTRSALTRDALRDALTRHNVSQFEQKHRSGYTVKPEKKEEFSVWESEQAWASMSFARDQ